jgi:hypothetical protein
MFRKPNSASGNFTQGNVKQIHPISNQIPEVNTKPIENIFKRPSLVKKNRLKFQRDD